MEFRDLSLARYSLRKMSDRPIEEEKLDLILKAAQSAPTAKNLQPQKVFILKSKESIEKALECTPCNFGAPIIFVIGYDSNISWHRSVDGKDHGDIDATIAVTQMMLQAAELGLNTTFVGMFDEKLMHEKFPEMANINITAMLPIGYPREDAHPAKLHLDRKPIEEIVKVL